MPRRVAGLSAQKVRTAKPGRHSDGDHLYLIARGPEAGWWVFRYIRNGKLHELGLGRARGRNAVSLADARVAAGELRAVLQAGRDPLQERRQRKTAEAAETEAQARRAITFRTVAEEYLEAHAPAWSNPKHRAQWAATLAAYAYPAMGDVPIADVSTEHVLTALRPIWQAKPETAARVRGRIEAVLIAGAVRGLRSAENPARWRGHLAELLPARSKVAAVEHHAALPFADLPAFLLRLQAADGMGARALELAILTAARTGEILGATWGELDLEAASWTIPAARMKAGRDHRVPLSPPALALLRRLATIRQGDHVFPGMRGDRALSNMAMLATLRRMGRGDLTAHGFRSTFRDWAAETTAFPSEVVEMALAHTIPGKTEAAYRRGDLFDKRRDLMNAWAGYCAGPVANVLPMRRATASADA